ncbi:MAG: hypothetical protein IPL96_08540 [Holophagaceae bacterium]|nr:hypothetical protein [Holophagaceae bacterium]
MKPTPFRSLDGYLAEVARGLGNIPSRRRILFLREVGDHLLDEAEAKGIQDDAGMRELLSTKEMPHELARELGDGDIRDSSHRQATAIAGGILIGLGTGGHLVLTGWSLAISFAFGLTHGLAVGTGLFWVRHSWQRLGAKGRLAASIALSVLLSIPLGFTSTRGFVLSRLFYGAYTGYLFERHAQRRPLGQWLLEISAFTAFVFLTESLLLHRYPLGKITPWIVAMEWSFNATLHLAVIGALWMRTLLAERRVLTPQGQD